jgi:hypothetical protein
VSSRIRVSVLARVPARRVPAKDGGDIPLSRFTLGAGRRRARIVAPEIAWRTFGARYDAPAPLPISPIGEAFRCVVRRVVQHRGVAAITIDAPANRRRSLGSQALLMPRAGTIGR